jgi:hypothetical protein
MKQDEVALVVDVKTKTGLEGEYKRLKGQMLFQKAGGEFQTQKPASVRTQASNHDNFFISRMSLAKSSAIFSARSAR